MAGFLARTPGVSSLLRYRRCYSTRASEAALSLPYKDLTLPYRWLRDSCQCPRCLHPFTRQKFHRTSDIPADVQPAPNGVRYADHGIHIKWASDHDSFYSNELLDLYSSPSRLQDFHGKIEPNPWNAEKIKAAKDLFIPYGNLSSALGLHTAMTQLLRYGLLFVTGVPIKQTSNDTCELRVLAEKFSEIRTTFYGETWDVKAIRESRNIAYTNVFLGFHMDLLYFQHPPRFQILHCLRNRVDGGKSIFVDALHATSHLRSHHPQDFEVLTSTPVQFHYINDGHHLHQAHFTIELSSMTSSVSDSTVPNRPVQFVNYSPPFQAPLPFDTPNAFYPALSRFTDLLESPSRRYEYLLQEGDAVLFDNRRILHGRTEFRERGSHESGQSEEVADRWLKGCYFEADAMLDRWRVLGQKLRR